MRFDITIPKDVMQTLSKMTNRKKDEAWHVLKDKAVDIYYNAFYGRLQTSSFGKEGEDYVGSEIELKEKYTFEKDLLKSNIVYFDLNGDDLYTQMEMSGNQNTMVDYSYYGIGSGKMEESIDSAVQSVEFVQQKKDYKVEYNNFGIDICQRVQNYVNEYYPKDIQKIKGGK